MVNSGIHKAKNSILTNRLDEGGTYMKKWIALFVVLSMTVCLFAGCGAKQEAPAPTAAPAETAAPETESPAEPVELIVFAAASMTETLTKLGDQYMTDHPEVTLVFNFDSSGTLKTQIQEGADCDMFISAAPKQMDQLDIEASAEVNTEGLDFVDTATRVNLLENKVVLAVPDGNPKGIGTYDQLA